MSVIRIGTRIIDFRRGVGSGTGSGGAAFSTKSLLFDGANDWVQSYPVYSALDSSADWAYSFWIKLDDLSSNQNIFGISNGVGGGSAFVQCYWNAATSRLQMYFDGLSYYCRTDAALWTPVSGTWYHVLVTRDSTQPVGSKVTWFIDGDDCSLNESMTALPSTTATSGIYIGDNDGLSNSPMDGNIDEFAVYTQDMGAYKDEIYNGGTPDDLDNLATAPSPNLWYRMGENSTFKTPQILMPENTNKDKVSNYSMAFDGTSDYVDCGSFAGLNSATALTVSVWFKSSIYTNLGRLVNLEKHVEIYQSYTAASNTKGRFYYKLMGNYGNSFKTLGGTSASGVGDLIDGDWHHLCFVWDNSTTTAIVYEDGVAVQTNTSTTSGTLNSVSDNIYIGADPAGANPIQGSIDEVSIWDTALSPPDVAAVYGGGTPSDLTSLSPITWYRMGEEAAFDAIPTEWTIPDQAGSNDGTSANMDIYTRIGDAPDSPNNALSYNMDAVDIVEDTPPNP